MLDLRNCLHRACLPALALTLAGPAAAQKPAPVAAQCPASYTQQFDQSGAEDRCFKSVPITCGASSTLVIDHNMPASQNPMGENQRDTCQSSGAFGATSSNTMACFAQGLTQKVQLGRDLCEGTKPLICAGRATLKTAIGPDLCQ